MEPYLDCKDRQTHKQSIVHVAMWPERPSPCFHFAVGVKTAAECQWSLCQNSGKIVPCRQRGNKATVDMITRYSMWVRVCVSTCTWVWDGSCLFMCTCVRTLLNKSFGSARRASQNPWMSQTWHLRPCQWLYLRVSQSMETINEKKAPQSEQGEPKHRNAFCHLTAETEHSYANNNRCYINWF